MLHRQPRQPQRKRVPTCWLMADARLGDTIAAVLAAMPPRSAVVVRPYAMRAEGKAKLIRAIRRVARAKRHLLLLAGRGAEAGFDGRHGWNGGVPILRTTGFLSLPVHDRRQLAQAQRLRADAVLISPVWPTRSHPVGATLAAKGFSSLAATAKGRAVALGGMTHQRFDRLRGHGATGWAAIDAWLPDAGRR